jgi:hypothetical protein
VKNWFQSLPFKCNVQRYTMGLNEWSEFTIASGVINDDAKAKGAQSTAVGLCTLESS